MQTFLPYPRFDLSAGVLDDRRLGKQRVEAFQILRAITYPGYGWQHHPAVNMWRPYREALVVYGLTICAEWVRRGKNDTMAARIDAFSDGEPIVYPDWLGDDDVHLSHRSNLLRKDGAYRRHFPHVPANLPYVWPTTRSNPS